MKKKKRTLSDINADILSKDKVIAEYENVINIMKIEKEALETERGAFMRDTYYITVKVRNKTLEIWSKAGLLGFISEVGRAFILTDPGYKKRYESLCDIGLDKVTSSYDSVIWRDRYYGISTRNNSLTLCSCEIGSKSKETRIEIFNFKDGVPCLNCDDPNIERYPNGTVKIY